MKLPTLVLLLFVLSNTLFGQASGNVNYQKQFRYPDNTINVSSPSSADLSISVKGLANVKADSYVALFNVTQTGKTTEEVNRLINARIDQAIGHFKAKAGVESYVDMISFVPVYEYDVKKKIFSKNTYNEVPAGFELKKNIHIKYADSDMLNEIISVFAAAEIYDMIRVDYFSDNLAEVKKDLMTKAKAILSEKLANYAAILNVKLDTVEKHLSDGYSVSLPAEMYKSYQAFNSSALNLSKSASINPASKSTTLYYQPIIDKEFDFVLHPTILEPVIQVLYEMVLVVKREKVIERKVKDNYLLITPNGDIKNLKVK